MDHVTLHAPATAHAPGLLLRPWRADDRDAVLEAYRDPLMRRWLHNRLETGDDAAQWLEIQQDGWVTGNRMSFAVLEERQVAAQLVLKRPDPGGPSAEIGYWTAARARGRGVAGRALETVTAWAFDAFAGEGLDRLEIIHTVGNDASCRVAEKGGFALSELLPAGPKWDTEGHRHVRQPSPPYFSSDAGSSASR
ncbi:GNAT family N-acetyltransferase [Streptomyces sp. NPDC051322]|uniref:GNAT family N-acetyltransferase n=1 Tax=Streptomyces sp. NPDC051322 TaxID=3154645 RepID=UPI00344FB840